MFTTVLADPPWEYTQPLKMADGVKRSSKSQYRTMTVQEICDLYTPSKRLLVARDIGARTYHNHPGTLAGHLIDDTAILGLWITAPLLLEGVHQRVCNAWGFAPKQIVPWLKGRVMDNRVVIQPGMGALTRVCTEYLVLATRGQYTKLVKSHSENGLLLAEEDALIVAPKSRHSQKPVDQYRLLESLFPGPYLELFARTPRDGWTSWGNEMPPAHVEEEPPLPLEIDVVNEIDDGSRMRRTRAKRSAAVEECLKLFRRLNSPDDDAKTNHKRAMLLNAEIQCLPLAEQKAYYKAIKPIMDERHAERQRQAPQPVPVMEDEALPEPPVSWS